MTQVWMIRNSDTDIHLFNRREHLKPSVAISYSTCQDVGIAELWEPRKAMFTVTGKRGGVDFKEFVTATCFPVWTEPSHL